ncbi:peroxidase [Salvia divinorum]|uniref:Peroxidase n=1 Tax=Salvia divinorum TaxID=28513 RepID=A0ABD1G194_SALDI
MMAAEEAAEMDLCEAQPICQRPLQPFSFSGPPPLGQIAIVSGGKMQPNPTQKVTHSAFTPYKSNTHLSQFNPKPNLPIHNLKQIISKPNLPSKNLTIPQQLSLNQIIPTPVLNTLRPNSHPKQIPLHRQRPNQLLSMSKHPQPNKNNLSPSSLEKEIALALFGDPMHVPFATLPTTAHSLQSQPLITKESPAFPPLRLLSKPPLAEVGANGKDLNSRGKNAAPSSWADIAEKESSSKHSNCAVGTGGKGFDVEGQPKVIFGRSMADVLRSGQTSEGPILLDHARAEKRGEVRMIEGTPCLFFSTDESTDLAGRLGPAIVGKFSHSIPTAHQIQKALGNLKLVGTMSWNFLNAKHVFIQLSEMCDYAKILNGPNNSPVWYIEHHPMRVFKWTPDFDPFFEIPIVALWCNILALPIHLFEESALIAIGNLLGHAVQVDRATISRSRVSFARICVEVDISQHIPEEITLDIAGKRVTLKVKWDKIPLYCGECRHVGHNADNCYAFGRRPMPPKRDYSRGAPSKSGPSVQRHGDQPPPRQKRNDQNRENDQVREQEGQPRGVHATGDHRIVFPHAQSPGGQPHGRQILETQQRERQQVRGPAVRILQKGSTLLETALKAKGHLSDAGPSGTAMEETQEAEHDGFLVPKKKKKNRSAANRARKNVRRRQRKEHNSTLAEVESEGGGDHRSDGQDSALESDRGNGSLSPSYRPRHVDGPLAMVAVDNNMFGALEGFPSDDDEGKLAPDILDIRMIEASDSRTRLLELEAHGTGHTSPPSEGRLKKARLGASGAF